ncbi:MAG: ectoine hydroxylase-related dioxygenase (phytanoyl-CoA dioxygenase family) [Moritella dasanensis]
MTGAKSIKVWGTQLYLKPASDSKAVQIGFHRDSEHVNCFSKGMLTAWIPLNRMQKNSGMIQFVRGSHKWPVEFKNTHAGFSDIFTQRRLLMEETGELDWDERIAQVELGGLSFHHGDVVHASGLNLSGKDRCVLTVGLITDETIFIKKNDSYGLEEILDDPVSCPQIYKRN